MFNKIFSLLHSIEKNSNAFLSNCSSNLLVMYTMFLNLLEATNVKPLITLKLNHIDGLKFIEKKLKKIIVNLSDS